MRRIDWLVVHTAGAYDWRKRKVIHQPVEVIRAYHKMPKAQYDEHGALVPGTGGKGYREIGYHAYIEQDGEIRLGRGEDEMGAHVEGFNHFSLGICCSGDGDHEAFNPQQLATLVLRLVRWCRTYSLPAERCVGHRETDDHGGPQVFKTCPGLLVDLNEIRRLVRDKLERGPSV